MPSPAIAQAISAPYTPVWLAKRAGSWNTPAPTIEPTTIAVRAGRLSFEVVVDVSAAVVIGRPLPSARSPRCERCRAGARPDPVSSAGRIPPQERLGGEAGPQHRARFTARILGTRR